MRWLLVGALVGLAGCPRGDAAGGRGGAAPNLSPDAAARSALGELGAACQASDAPAVLAHLADQGLGGGPRYGRAMRTADPMADEIVRDLCADLPATQVVLATLATQSDGRRWVTVTLRDGADGSIAYRFVDVAGAWLLAEVD